MNSDVVVTGLVSGHHCIEDIQVLVPYKTAVRISAEAALRSKDLWRGIQQGRIFQLDVAPITTLMSSGPSSQEKRLAKALEESQKQVRALSESNSTLVDQNQILQGVVGGLQAQIEAIMASLGRLEARPIDSVFTRVSENGGARSGVVGGEIPTFIPTQIKADNIAAQIQPVTEEVSGEGVLGAASKLRSLKQQSST